MGTCTSSVSHETTFSITNPLGPTQTYAKFRVEVNPSSSGGDYACKIEHLTFANHVTVINMAPGTGYQNCPNNHRKVSWSKSDVGGKRRCDITIQYLSGQISNEQWRTTVYKVSGNAATTESASVSNCSIASEVCTH
jgi:hypothetical protein